MQPAHAAEAAAESGFNVIYPFAEAANGTLVLRPFFQQSFLAFLENNSVQAVLDNDGLPLAYFSGEPRFGCEGFCPAISMNNYTFGSKSLNSSGLANMQDMRIMNESMVIGNEGIEQSVDTMNAIRASLGGNPQALAAFERYLLEQQDGFLREAYYDELYKDVWDYAASGIRKDPGLYNSLLNDLRTDDINGAISKMDDYMQGNFDINGAFDLENMYSAIENGELGNMQTEEFMRNVLKKIAETENMGSIKNSLDNVDLEKLSGLLKTDEFRKMMEKAGEMMKDNPGMFGKLGDLAKEMLERPETAEVFKEALKEMMKKGDWESIKSLMDAFSKMDNKQELMETLMKGMGEYMREMVESGKMDEMMKQMNDPAMKEMMAEASKSFSQGMLENAWDWIKKTPVEFSYVVALIAIIVTLAILMKLRI
jgi:hypothetical protein